LAGTFCACDHDACTAQRGTLRTFDIAVEETTAIGTADYASGRVVLDRVQ
jgi:hypothetical protein